MMLAQIFCSVFGSYLAPYQRRSALEPLQEIVNWTHPSDFAEGRPNGAQPERTIVTPKLRFFSRAWGGNYKTCDLNKMRQNHCKNGKKWDVFLKYSYHSWHTSGDGTIPLHHWLRISLGQRMGGEAKHIHLKSSWDSMGQFACHYCECLSRYISASYQFSTNWYRLSTRVLTCTRCLRRWNQRCFSQFVGSVRKTLTMPFDIVNPLLIYTVGEVLVSGLTWSWLAKVVGFYDGMWVYLIATSNTITLSHRQLQQKK